MTTTKEIQLRKFEKVDGVPFEDAVILWLNEHEKHDHERHEHFESLIASMPDKEDYKKLATKKDTEDILRVFNAVKTAIDVTERGGKWGYRAILTLASLVVAFGIISGGWKGMIAWGASQLSQFIATKP